MPKSRNYGYVKRPPIKGRVLSRPVYRVHRENDMVEMAQDYAGLWWFRYTTLEKVPIGKPHVRKGEIVRYEIKEMPQWCAWYLPKSQPNPRFMPGESARRLRGKAALLPVNHVEESNDRS